MGILSGRIKPPNQQDAWLDDDIADSQVSPSHSATYLWGARQGSRKPQVYKKLQTSVDLPIKAPSFLQGRDETLKRLTIQVFSTLTKPVPDLL